MAAVGGRQRGSTGSVRRPACLSKVIGARVEVDSFRAKTLYVTRRQRIRGMKEKEDSSKFVSQFALCLPSGEQKLAT